MRHVGIDYSMSSPCVAIEDGGNFSYYYLTDKKKYTGTFAGCVHGHQHKGYNSNEERFDNITDWVLSLLNIDDYVNIEGYALGSTGLIFNIAENTGLLKHKMYKNGIKFTVTTPMTNKKSATGKGNAKKDQMYAAFKEETGLDLLNIFGCKTVANPVSDIADAYFLAKYNG